MTLIRWQKPVTAACGAGERWPSLADELDQLFGRSIAEFTRGAQLPGWSPVVDVFEDKDAYTVKAELPGLKKEEIEVSVHDGTLVISGERKLEQKTEGEVHRTERFYGKFQRVIGLPAQVEANKVQAGYKDGVLTITLPKTEQVKPRQIAIAD
jgi:HSP20 family protein